MKSCEFIKGTLGLSEYSDKDVFDGYAVLCLDGRNYVTDKTSESIYRNSDNIKYRVISNCIPSKG